jgi:ribosomal protein S18 acetylase RimI-like enzyme
LVELESGRLAGFYTLSSHSIALTDLAAEWTQKLPRYPSVPAALIGWLARDLSFRGQSVGSMLLYDAIARLAASPAGVHAICADAIDADAAAFYRVHGFEAFASRPQSFYLPMKTALALINEPAWGG